MLIFLRVLFLVVLASMVAVTAWASGQCALFNIPRDVFTHPWFIATLVDAYWAFIAFFIWVAWKEQSLAARVLWFIAIILLGNIAIAGYMLRELFHIRTSPEISLVFTRRNPGTWILPGALVSLAVGVYLLA